MSEDAATENRPISHVSVAEAVRDNPVWYHTIELAPGVVTPGQIDLRDAAPKVLPSRLDGLRALDVGAFDGFWTFEMERRGADVVAIDVDKIESAEWPPLSRARLERTAADWGIELGRGFRVASEAIGSNARRVVCNVYEVTPDVIDGQVDFVFSGAIMLHLRNPVHALERLWHCLKPGGELRLLEPFSPWYTLTSPRKPAAAFQAADSDFNWWVPNLAGIAAWLRAAGFVEIERVARLRSPAEERMRQHAAAFTARRPRA